MRPDRRGFVLVVTLVLVLVVELAAVVAYRAALAGYRATGRYRSGIRAREAAESEGVRAILSWDSSLNYPSRFPVDSARTSNAIGVEFATSTTIRREALNLFSIEIRTTAIGGSGPSERRVTTFLALPIPPPLAAVWDTISPPGLGGFRPVRLPGRSVWFDL